MGSGLHRLRSFFSKLQQCLLLLNIYSAFLAGAKQIVIPGVWCVATRSSADHVVEVMSQPHFKPMFKYLLINMNVLSESAFPCSAWLWTRVNCSALCLKFSLAPRIFYLFAGTPWVKSEPLIKRAGLFGKIFLVHYNNRILNSLLTPCCIHVLSEMSGNLLAHGSRCKQSHLPCLQVREQCRGWRLGQSVHRKRLWHKRFPEMKEQFKLGVMMFCSDWWW